MVNYENTLGDVAVLVGTRGYAFSLLECNMTEFLLSGAFVKDDEFQASMILVEYEDQS